MTLNCSAETNTIDSNTVSIKYIVSGWLTLIFCVFGMITNTFTVIVLLHPRMRNSSTHVYLMALSACNVFLLAGLLINYSLKSIASYTELLAYLHQPDLINRNALLANQYEQFYAHVAPITTPLLSMLLLCSTYLTVLVSGDRYFLICWPLVAERLRTRKMALRLVFLVFILVNIYILPHWFEYRTETRVIKTYYPSTMNNLTLNETFEQSDTSNEETLVELTYTNLGSNAIYLSIYRFYLNVPITFVIPFTLLTLCNGSMIHQLLLIKQKKKRLGHRMKADIRITTMLIVIVLTFMLCRSLNLFVNLLVQLSPCLNKNSLHRFNAFANLLIAFNGFINFFLFAAFGQRFREMVFYIFFRRGRYPFLSPTDVLSVHRAGASVNSPISDYYRRQSRRNSTNDSELWAAIARRKSSATMAILHSTNDTRTRSTSQSMANTSHLNIPKSLNHNNHQQHETSDLSISITDQPTYSNQSCQQLTLDNHENSSMLPTNTLTIPTENSVRISSPNRARKRPDDFIEHHVKFV